MQAMTYRGFTAGWRWACAAALMTAAVFAGCGDGGAGREKEAAVTPEVVAGEIRPVLAPLEGLLAGPPSNNGNFALVDAEWCRGLAEQVRQARAKYEGTENGKVALGRIADELEGLIRRAREEDRWGLVLCAVDVHEELRPGMHLMRLLRKRAMLHAMRPHVVVKGFFDDNDRGELYVFLKVTLRAGYRPWPGRVPDGTDGGGEEAPEGEGEGEGAAKALEHDEVHMVQVRLNEEFYGLRLVDVVGKKRGVVLEYLADPGHFFEVMTPPREYGPRRRIVSGAPG